MVPPDVQEFAREKGVSQYLPPLIQLVRRAFPASTLAVSLGRDAEDETHQYIALDVDASGLDSAQLLAGQRSWSEGVSQLCPSARAVYFVLGWR
jgi:hypothetical protein